MKLVLLIFVVSLSGCTVTNPFQKAPTVEEIKNTHYTGSFSHLESGILLTHKQD